MKTDTFNKKPLDHSKNTKDACLMDTSRILKNAEKSRTLATALFPLEQWIPTEPNIWVAKSRLAIKYREIDKWEREMAQARILISRGSAAYFLLIR